MACRQETFYRRALLPAFFFLPWHPSSDANQAKLVRFDFSWIMAYNCRAWPIFNSDGQRGNRMATIVRVFRAMTYRGREGQIAWILHRLTGLGVFTFLALHIVDIFLMSFGPDLFESLLFVYHKFIFKLGIILGLYPGLVYHGLNGIRVLIIDFWPGVGKKQAMLWRIQIAIFATIYIPSAILMGSSMFRQH